MVSPIVSLLVSLILGAFFTPIVIGIAKRRSWIVQPRKDRWHSKPTALMGGIAIFSAFLISSIIFGVFDKNNILILLALVTIFVIGLVDDFFEIKPVVKLIGQITCTIFLLYYENYFGNGIFSWVGIPLTFFWVIGITNAINLLDNMDGLAAGISAFISLFSGIILLQNGNIIDSIFAFSISGAALGFLIYNFNPAKIFMGDSGSLFLGFSVSYLSLVLQKDVGSVNGFLMIVLPLGLMAIPIMDTTLVTVKRIIAGRRVSQGGKDHTSNRLVALGLSEKKSVIILYLICITWGLISLLILRLELSTALLFLFLLTVFSLGFALILSSVKVYDESEEKLTYLRLRGQSLGNALFLRFFLMNKKIIGGLIIDISIIFISFFMASRICSTAVGQQYFLLAIFILTKIICFYFFNLYNRLWRYISTRELISQLVAVFVSSIALYIVLILSKYSDTLSVNFFVVDFLITLIAIVFSRLTYRVLKESIGYISSIKLKRVLIYGAGDAGNLLLKELLQNNKYGLKPVGWLDDDSTKKNMILGGLRVYGGEESLANAIRKSKADMVIVSTNSLTNEKLNRVSQIISDCEIRLGKISFKLEI